jgi:predicted GNAT superfamily acetyltransferase
LNDADLLSLSPLTLAGLERLAAIASYLCVAEVDGSPAAFLLAISSETPYEGANFLWFKERYSRFLYVDRIVVGARARRAGIASQLYGSLEAHAGRARAPIITCEINLRPANPESLAFHDRHGFVEVGTRDVENGNKTLSMRVKELAIEE